MWHKTLFSDNNLSHDKHIVESFVRSVIGVAQFSFNLKPELLVEADGSFVIGNYMKVDFMKPLFLGC